ncbi:MAG: DUF1801 domain-containing protein [Flavisolibacter sp.]
MKKNTKSDDEKVNEYMELLVHPLKKEMEAVRAIIKNSNPKIAERIKWNAPSYYYKEDLATFNPRAQQHIHIVFHHKTISEIKSDILEGDYKDRRMMYLKNMKEINQHKQEMQRIMNELVGQVNRET